MKVLVLAGGFDQIELIRKIKQRGHEVVLADFYENPPAKTIAHKHYQVSTLNTEEIEQVVIKEGIELITTACTDQALLTVAKVSEKFGLPTYISYNKALSVTNKKYMKECFDKLGILTAQSKTFSNMEELKSFLPQIMYPVVIKPCDCNSSKGVKKVNDEKELLDAANNAFVLSRSSLIIVEEYISGREISIDVWVDKQDAKVLSISETVKFGQSEGNFTICGSRYPVAMSQVAKEKVHMIANDIASGFGLSNCPMLIQAIINDDDIYVIEFSARMGGGTKYRLIEHMSGIDIMEVYVNRVFGDEDQIVEPENSNNQIELDYVYTRNGVFDKLKGFEENKLEGNITEYYQYKEKGASITQAKTSSDRVAGFLLVAENSEELESKRKKVVNTVEVLDSENQDIILKTLFEK